MNGVGVCAPRSNGQPLSKAMPRFSALRNELPTSDPGHAQVEMAIHPMLGLDKVVKQLDELGADVVISRVQPDGITRINRSIQTSYSPFRQFTSLDDPKNLQVQDAQPLDTTVPVYQMALTSNQKTAEEQPSPMFQVLQTLIAPVLLQSDLTQPDKFSLQRAVMKLLVKVKQDIADVETVVRADGVFLRLSTITQDLISRLILPLSRQLCPPEKPESGEPQ
ncbi:MAG: hypothetical protein K2X01_11880 [Cyanobacteria bacterium]|nr:hypothetical protein [Cyanobacteriota bacterium]